MSRVVWLPNLLAPGACQMGNLNSVGGCRSNIEGKFNVMQKRLTQSIFCDPEGAKICQPYISQTERYFIWTKEEHIPTHKVSLLEEKLKSLLHPRSSCSGRASPDQGGWGQKRRRTHNPSQPPWPLVGRPTSFKKLRGRNHIWRNVQ